MNLTESTAGNERENRPERTSRSLTTARETRPTEGDLLKRSEAIEQDAAVKRKAAAAGEIKMITLTVSAADEFVDTLSLMTKDTRRESDCDTTLLIEKRLETEAACEYSQKLRVIG
jgi:hypothetical protein